MDDLVNIAEKTCKNCSKRISSDAKKCHHCQTWQSWYFWLHDLLNIVQILSLGASFLMAWFAFNQATEARLALSQIQQIENKIQGARKEIQITDANLKLVVKAAVENEFILASSSFLAMGESKARERLEKNLDILTNFIENDKTSSEKWWATLQDLFKERTDAVQKTFSDGRYAIGSVITGQRISVQAQLKEAMSALNQEQFKLAHEHINKALELFTTGEKEAKAFGGVVHGGEDPEELERSLYKTAFYTAKKLNLTNEANSYINDHWFGPEGTARFARDLAQMGEREAAKAVLNRVFQKEPDNKLAAEIKEELKL